jgi:Uma2 family endonuclease
MLIAGRSIHMAQPDTSVAASGGGDLHWPQPVEAEANVKRATYEDVLNAPDNQVAEILDGELILSPRPAPRHSLALSRLVMLLGDPFDRGHGGPGGWWILAEPELHFGTQILVPDVAGWRRERLPSLPDAAWFTLAPDWVCEVLSPSTERIDRAHKLRIYAEAGVAHAWLVDPMQRTLEALRLREGSWMIGAVITGKDPARVEPFDLVELELGRLWAEA